MSSIPGVDCIEKTELAVVEHFIDVEENQDNQTNDLVSIDRGLVCLYLEQDTLTKQKLVFKLDL